MGVLIRFVAWLVGSLIGVRRGHVLASLEAARIAEAPRVADAMYRSLARGLFELVGLLLRPGRPIGERVILPEAAELGGAMVVATAHTGNWDLMACAAAERVPLTVVTKRLSIGVLDRIWQRLRARRGVSLVQAGSAVSVAREALARGEAVAMLIDQAPERERASIVEPFLGQPARVDLAPALVALRARVPLVAAFGYRREDGRHQVEVCARVAPPAHPSRAWAEDAMRTVTRALDAFVRRHPEQWLWMHRRWKDAPAASLSWAAQHG